MIYLSIVKNVLNTTFELECGMRKSLITETCYEVSIVFRKESYIHAKKVLNSIQSLTNEKTVINP